MGDQKKTNNGTEKDILDSNDLIDLDIALDDLTESLDTATTANNTHTIDDNLGDLPDYSSSEPDFPTVDLPDIDTASADKTDSPELDMAELDEDEFDTSASDHTNNTEFSAEEARQAADLAAQASAEAEAKAVAEAQTAADAMATAKAAMAAAEAAEKTAVDAKEAAQAKAAVETKAAEEAKAAIEAEAQAKQEAEAKAKAEAEANAKAEAETKAKAEAETKAKAEAETKAKAEAETKAKAEAETKAKAEAETKAKAEAETKAKAEAAPTSAAAESEDFLDINLDEYEEPAAEEELETLESLSSLEKDLGELTDWNEAEAEPSITAQDKPALQESEINEKTATEATTKEQQSTPVQDKEESMTTNKKSGSSILNGIMLSFALVAILVAGLAIWMSLDAAQKTTELAAEPAKLQQKIKLLEQHQEKQVLLLQQQIENLQDQLKILTKVISNKKAEQWRSATQKPDNNAKQRAVKKDTSPVAQKPASKSADAKPSVSAINTTSPIKKTTKKALTTPVKSAVTTASNSPYGIDSKMVQGWVVYLFSTTSQKSAERETAKFRAKDIKANFFSVMSKGKLWYHVMVSGFETERKAAAFKKFLNEYHGIDAWYNKSAHKITKAGPAPVQIPKAVASNNSAQENTVKKKTANSHEFQFKSTGSDVWLQVFAPNAAGTGKGTLLTDVLLKPGNHSSIQAASDTLWITTGNAPGLSISVDGKVIAKTGSLGAGKSILRNYRVSIK